MSENKSKSPIEILKEVLYYLEEAEKIGFDSCTADERAKISQYLSDMQNQLTVIEQWAAEKE